MRHFRSKKENPEEESILHEESVPADEKSGDAGEPCAVPAEEPSTENTAEFAKKNDGDAPEASPEKTTGTEENPVSAKLADDLAAAMAELSKTKEAYLRSVAEFDNYRRRNNEEKPKIANYAKGELAKDIFPILDNFKLGLEAAEKQHPEAKSITEGFAMIASQIRAALSHHNIVEINPVGAAFDPNEHESLTSQPSADVPEDHVLFVHRVGYKIGDRLLRPASVVISSGNPEKKPE